MSVFFTVGYEGTDIDRFVETLKLARIRQLIDVRAVAISRKKGFSKKKLAERLAAEGIDYLHLIELGDPKPGREAARKGHYDDFRRIYTEHLEGPTAQIALGTLIHHVSKAPTSLLCFERDPKVCHRMIVAESVKRALGFVVFHLYADEPKKYERHAAELPVFQPPALAAE